MLDNMIKNRIGSLRLARFSAVLILLTASLLFFRSPQANAFTINEYTLPAANSGPTGITVGPDGNLWFTEYRGYIGRITTDGVITEFSNPSDPPMFPGGLLYSGGITAGPDGNIWFTESISSGVVGNSNIGIITTSGGINKIPFPNSQLIGITMGPDGNIWLADFNGAIVRATPAGGITIFPASAKPVGITAGPDDNIWFTDSGTPNKIDRITITGTDLTQFIFNSCAANTGSEGIVVGPDGNIWFTQKNANKIGRITTGGVVSEFTIPTADSEPKGITAGSDGNIWFTESHANKIARITPAGIITEFTVPTGDSFPFGIAAGPDGNIWFTEWIGNKVGQVVIAPPLAQIAAIVKFFDASVSGGTLSGLGPTPQSAKGHLGALRNMFVSASNLIDSGKIADACQQLSDAYMKTDCVSNPSDFVIGPAAAQLASQIQSLMASLGCQ